MRTALSTLALATSLFWTGSAALADEAHRPVYGIGGQYSAVLYQASNVWQLMPADGPDQVVSPARCGASQHLPNGVWLVGQDANGRPELIAPSTTPLPPGSPGQVPLRACGDADGKALLLPQSLLDQLRAQVGAVYIDD
jgi:hypothetical protein